MSARSSQAVVKRFAVYVREYSEGKYMYLARPYDLVEYDWGNGEVIQYIQPHHSSGYSRVGAAAASANKMAREAYDDVRIYNTPPWFDLSAPSR